MKSIAIALLPALLLSTSPAQAWVGGPWDHNIAGGQTSASGTFQGVIKGQNVMGILVFGVSATSANAAVNSSSTTVNTGININISNGGGNNSVPTVVGGMGTTGNEGRVAVFADGRLVVGALSAVMDLDNRTINGVFDASRIVAVETISERDRASTTTTNTTASSSYTYTAVENVSGYFDGVLDHTFPDITFSASGEITISSPAEPFDITELVVGASLDPNAASADTGLTITKLTPVVNKSSLPIIVTGVRTANVAPVFTTNVQLQQSTVVSSGNGF